VWRQGVCAVVAVVVVVAVVAVVAVVVVVAVVAVVAHRGAAPPPPLPWVWSRSRSRACGGRLTRPATQRRHSSSRHLVATAMAGGRSRRATTDCPRCSLQRKRRRPTLTRGARAVASFCAAVLTGISLGYVCSCQKY
jgi:hypothetical protein